MHFDVCCMITGKDWINGYEYPSSLSGKWHHRSQTSREMMECSLHNMEKLRDFYRRNNVRNHG